MMILLDPQSACHNTIMHVMHMSLHLNHPNERPSMITRMHQSHTLQQHALSLPRSFIESNSVIHHQLQVRKDLHQEWSYHQKEYAQILHPVLRETVIRIAHFLVTLYHPVLQTWLQGFALRNWWCIQFLSLQHRYRNIDKFLFPQQNFKNWRRV